MTTDVSQQAIDRLLARPPLRRLFKAFSGEEIRVVGGAVRNALLGEAIADIDIAAAALPEVIAEKARKAGLRVVPTGVEHGTLSQQLRSKLQTMMTSCICEAEQCQYCCKLYEGMTPLHLAGDKNMQPPGQASA